MDHHRHHQVEEEEEEEEEEEIEIPEDDDDDRKKGLCYLVLRLTLAFLFPVFAFFVLSTVVVFAALFSGHFSISSPVSVPSQCKIVSSIVDLRSSKVCELGLLNYKAKHVFYPFERSKFRCRYDYYWASVFEVEYKDHSWGQKRLALAEAPSEALPLNCRPNFGAVWLTKDKFKVNETYDCWYTSSISKVTLYQDGFFSCQAKDPSPVEMLRRYFFLSTKILKSWSTQNKNGKTKYWRWESILGFVTGLSTSLISISFIVLLQQMKSQLSQTYVAKMVARVISTVFFRRACFLVAYFSVVGWLTIQYGRRLGLPEIYRVYNY